MGQESTRAVIAADIARAASPATIDALEDDLAVGGGLGFRFLATRAQGILHGARSANPLCHDGSWAFDIDGFVVLTNVPHGAKTLREAREVLDATLRRSLEVDGAHTAHVARTAWPDLGIEPIAGAHASPAPQARNFGTRPSGTSAAPCSPARRNADGATIERVLSQAHYTRIPAWLLDGSLSLTVSERIMLADILDVMARGTALSFEADRTRIARRCGLGASTVSCALRGLVGHGILTRPHDGRGRYALSWEALAGFARTGATASKAVGHARAQADIRRRLCDTRGGLAVPAWAVECCGASEAALLLSKAWACAHAGGEGVVWASGQTLAQWLPGAERSLRRARASLAQRGLVALAPQHSHMRAYRTGTHSNRTAEFHADAKAILRALLVRGHDFGDLSPLARELFSNDADICRDAAAWDALRIARSRARAHRVPSRHMAAAGQGAPDAPCLAMGTEHTSRPENSGAGSSRPHTGRLRHG